MPARFDLVLLEILSLASLSSLHLVMADGRKTQSTSMVPVQANTVLVILYQIMCWMKFLILLLVFILPVARLDIEIRIKHN